MTHGTGLVLLAAVALVPTQSRAQSRGSASDSIVVRDAWVRATSPARTVSAGYLTIENRSRTALTLRRIAVSGVRHAELHAVTTSAGRSGMQPVAGVTIPAHGSISLAPGGTHVMLTGVVRPLAVGATVRMTLTFDGGVTRTIQARVRPLDAEPVT